MITRSIVRSEEGLTRVMIAEDERASREALAAFVTEYEGLELVGSHASGSDALEAMLQVRPDLLLLDIEMPGLSGLQVVEGIPAPERPAVVFITGHTEHATDAFDLDAVDYIVKPFDDERVHLALRRAIRRLDSRAHEEELDGSGSGRARGTGWIRRLLVQTSGRSAFFLPVDQIDYLEAERNYVRIHHEGEAHLIRSSLSEMEERLDPAAFRRVHRSYMVNLGRAEAVEPRGVSDYQVVLETGDAIPVGRAYRDHVLTDA